MPLGAIPWGQKLPQKRSKAKPYTPQGQEGKMASESKSGPKTRNSYHAQLEAKCGLVEVITLLYPHLEGEVAIDGESFACPLPMHLDGDPRTVKVTPGRKWDKPYWKCQAGCCKDKGNDTIDFLRSALGIRFAKAISLWAKLAASEPDKWHGIVAKAYPHWYSKKGKAA
jgi:hypothetical protein